MKYLAQELGRTVRAALQSWPETARLCILITVLAAILVIWTYYRP